MIRFLLFSLLFMSTDVLASQLTCEDEDKILSTTEGMLRSLLLPVSFQKPIEDARARIKLHEFRLWAYGDVTGMVIPGDVEFKRILICRIGTRPMYGVSDSFHSEAHVKLAAAAKAYAKEYNTYILRYLMKIKAVDDLIDNN